MIRGAPVAAIGLILVALPGLAARGVRPAAAAAGTPARAAAEERLPGGRVVARVYYHDAAEIGALVSHDLLEFHDPDERYVLVLVDAAELSGLLAEGWRAEVDPRMTDRIARRSTPGFARGAGISGYGCYRTVEESYAAAAQLAVDRPDLALWSDVGDSWEKQQGLGGYDLSVLRLTNTAIAGDKPKLMLTASIHGREYAPAELATRFAEFLVRQYGIDADATWLLDHHEVHLILQANPDGRKQAEAGELWRKNTNGSYCGASSPQRGADLNRNFDHDWGCCGGSSIDECNELFRGAGPASEPEVQAIQGRLRSIFPDQRGPGPGDAAPSDATGVYLDLHSFGRLVLWPWGQPVAAPNEGELRTLARKLAWFNGYTPLQAFALYVTDGTASDFGYGDLGVAAYTFELGTVFFEDCETFESTIVPDNIRSLTYAAKVSRTPYLTPSGPDAAGAAVSPLVVDPGGSLTVAATIDDTRSSTDNGTEPVQNVSAAEYYVDVPPWVAAPAPVARALVPVDGTFDAPVESVAALLDTTGLAGGRHILFLRGRDADGNWGAIDAAFFWVEDGTSGTLAGVVTDADSGEPLAATVSVDYLGAATTSHPTLGSYDLVLPAGIWALRAAAPGYADGVVEGFTVADGSANVQDFALVARPRILLVDDDDDAPDVREAYTTALDALGRDYVVWETGAGQQEPAAEDLAAFDVAIWFSGARGGGAAGPSASSETALAGWLDGSGCLLVSSPDYHLDRGLSTFMKADLGAFAVSDDVGQQIVTGQGSVFAPLGLIALSHPYPDRSDALAPFAFAQTGFSGFAGDAALTVDAGHYRTSFWGFGFESFPAAGDREAALDAFLHWCDPLPQLDGDGDGVPNRPDCDPDDDEVWRLPDPAGQLSVSSAATDNLSWVAPADPGAAQLRYDLLRSDDPADFSAPTCVASDLAVAVATDAEDPAPNTVRYFVVRTVNGCGSNAGRDAQGVPRTTGACP